jgi:hypothetical protein
MLSLRSISTALLLAQSKTLLMQRVVKHLARIVANVRDYCATRDASMRAA